jgi:hypothetical protein
LIPWDFCPTVVAMSRSLILVFGLICWSGVAANAVVHMAFGDWLLPVVMALFFVGWVALFRRYSRTATAS